MGHGRTANRAIEFIDSHCCMPRHELRVLLRYSPVSEQPSSSRRFNCTECCGNAFVHMLFERAATRGHEIETCGGGGAYIKTSIKSGPCGPSKAEAVIVAGLGTIPEWCPCPPLSQPQINSRRFPSPLSLLFSHPLPLLSSTCQATFSRNERSPSLAPAQLVIVARLYHPMVILIPTSPRQASHPS